MNRRTVAVAVVAFFAVLAVAAGAATLDSTVDTGSGGAGDAGPVFDLGNRTPGGGGPNATFGNVTAGGGDTNSLAGGCPAPLQSPLFAYGMVALGALAFAGLWRRYGSGMLAFFGLGVFLPVAFVVYAVVIVCESVSLQLYTRPDANASIPPAVEEAAAGAAQSPSLPSAVAMAAIVLAVAVLGVVLFRQTRGGPRDDIAPAEEADDDAEGRLAALGEAAGSAADRIEAQAGVDNEVYRAWREMADSLETERPETSTPGEFADAAVDAGMDSDDVEELTRLFEEVRYGDAAATADREQRAVSILRRIEAAYGEPGSGVGSGGPGGGR